jgi:hypothetical protein
MCITKSDERIYEYVLPCRKYKPGLGIYYRKTDLYLPCIQDTVIILTLYSKIIIV